MSLSDLPREILLDITDYLNVRGTNALARTNSGLYQLLDERLYRQDVAKPISRSLAWAAENGMVCTAQRAIDATQCFNPIPESFYKALQVASYQGHVHLVELLLKINGIDSNPKFTPLTSACSQGHVSIVRQFLARDVDLNCLIFGYTPLIAACRNGHKEVVKLLLDDSRVKVNLGDRIILGYTPLIAACNNGHKEVVKLLLDDSRVKVNLGDKMIPLVKAVELGSVELVKWFLARGDLEINTVNNKGEHVLGSAVTKGYLDIVKLLLEQEGIEVNRQFGRGLTPLCAAAMWNRPKTGKLLLEREDIDVNLPNDNQETPLYWSAENLCPGILDLLLKKDGINPNPRMRNGETPLAFVCRCRLGKPGSVAIVRSLLSHPDTDPNAVNNDGVSILAAFMNARGYMDNLSDLSRCEVDEIELLLRDAGAIVGLTQTRSTYCCDHRLRVAEPGL